MKSVRIRTGGLDILSFYSDLLDSGLLGCDARLMLASLKGPQPTLFLARTLYW